MAAAKNSTILIKNADNEAYNLGSITTSPRGATAVDMQAGLDNLIIEIPDDTNELVSAVVRYLFHDYFAQAHQTGLYNRQIRLWEMFSRVTTAEVRQVERGIFTKTQLPVYEVVMKTALGQSPICALVIDQKVLTSDAYKNQAASGKVYVELLRDFLLKVMKIQARLGVNGVKGIFVVSPEPLDAALLAYIEKETNATDAVSRVESIMPAPVSAHINLLTYRFEHNDETGPLAKPEISLAYPNIVRKAAAR
ncbi:MAG: hypothetical protein JST01_05655 [Cyanobacteria bacterium SZAS TMP-1]|nr:hypothetical protein [Cyanobacteria bacterium SZAS TMP-1]